MSEAAAPPVDEATRLRGVVREFLTAEREWQFQQSRVMWSSRMVVTHDDPRFPTYSAARDRYFAARAALEVEGAR